MAQTRFVENNLFQKDTGSIGAIFYVTQNRNAWVIKRTKVIALIKRM